MQYDVDCFCEVMPLLKDFLYHLASYRMLYSALKKLPGECEWIDATVAGQILDEVQNITLKVKLNGTPINNMVQTISMTAAIFSTFATTNFEWLEEGDELTLTLAAATTGEPISFYFPIFGVGPTLTVQKV